MTFIEFIFIRGCRNDPAAALDSTKKAAVIFGPGLRAPVLWVPLFLVQLAADQRAWVAQRDPWEMLHRPRSVGERKEPWDVGQSYPSETG